MNSTTRGAAIAALILCLPSFTAAESVWVVGNRSLEQLDLTSATTLASVGTDSQLRSVATDAARGVVWTYGSGVLTRWSEDGTALSQVEIARSGDGPIAVDPTTGAVWVAAGNTLQRFDASGAGIGESALSGDIAALAITTSGRWVAIGDMLYGLDAGAGVITELQVPQVRTISDISIATDGSVWVAGQKGVALVGADGTILGQASGRAIAVSADDAAWITDGQTVSRVAAPGDAPSSAFRPSTGNVVALSADPRDGSIWVLTQQSVDHYDSTGWMLASHSGNRGRGNSGTYWDLDLSLDLTPPTLAIVSPTDGSVLADTQPTLVLEASDAGSGVDADSITVSVDGDAVVVDCNVSGDRIGCAFQSPLPQGSDIISVQVSDAAGNRSDEVTISVLIDTVPPVISLTAPGDGTQTFAGSITVAGVLDEAATLIIAGQPVTVAPDLSFQTSVALSFGDNTIPFTAADTAGNTASGSVTVQRPHSIPIITSTPSDDDVEAGDSFSYQLSATDPDPDDVLTFVLVGAPDGAALSPEGLISWQTADADVGEHTFSVSVVDRNGDAVTQTFTVTVVISNLPPEFTSLPTTEARAGYAYSYTPSVSDPDGTTGFSFSLPQAPAGMTIDAGTGAVSWLPDAATPAGSYAVSLAVADDRGAVVTQDYALTLYPYVPEPSHQGTDFWVTVSNISLSTTHPTLLVSAAPGTGGSATFGATTLSFVTDSDGLATVVLPRAALTPTNISQRIVASAIHITTASPATVVVLDQSDKRTDSYLALPTPQLGTEYLATSFMSNGSLMEVIAVEDGTQVTLIPSDDIIRDGETAGSNLTDPAGTPIVFTLDQGEVFVLVGDSRRRQDYTGTEVLSSNPVAVLGGHNCATVPLNVGHCDLLMDQMQPVPTWGTEYYAVPFAQRLRADRYRIVAATDGTRVERNGVFIGELDRGEVIDDHFAGVSRFMASAPISVAQFMPGTEWDASERRAAGLDDDLTDPALVMLQSAATFRRDYRVHEGFTIGPDAARSVSYLNLVLPDEALASLRVDGIAPATQTVAIGDLTLHIATIEVGTGVVELTADAPFGAYAYGYNDAESYAHTVGMRLPSALPIADLQILGTRDVAGGEAACIGVRASSTDGTPVFQAPVIARLEGSPAQTVVGYTSPIGEAQLCFEQPSAGTRAVAITAGNASASAALSWSAGGQTAQDLAPVFISAPARVVERGEVFQYAAQAVDPYGAAVSYSLATTQSGLSVDPASGLVTWSTSSGSPYQSEITLLAHGASGVAGVQTFALTVDRAPRLGFQPSPRSFNIGSTYRRNFEVRDDDADAITPVFVEIVQGADDFDINPGQTDGVGQDQYLELINPGLSLGEHPLVLRATDRWGVSTDIEITITVTEPNVAPRVTSTPVTVGEEGVPYAYPIIAVDDNVGDVISYSLFRYPVGMVVDSASGLVTWDAPVVGVYDIWVVLEDTRGASVLHRYTLTISPRVNTAPTFTYAPAHNAKVGHLYQQLPSAVDAEGDALNYSLAQAPAGMSIDAQGLITWTPSSTGLFDVVVRVDDGSLYSELGYPIDVASGSVPLAIELVAVPAVADPGETFVITRAVTGATGPYSETETLDGQPISFDAAGEYRVSFDQPGTHIVSGQVTDDSGSANDELRLLVRDPSDVTPPEVTISGITEGQEITAPTLVTGSVIADDLAYWQLFVIGGEPGAEPFLIAEGDSAFDGTAFASFDPTLLLNGNYRLQLRAFDGSGNGAATDVAVQVLGEMKVGFFAMAFEDLSIPLAGIPITVTRSYDSRTRHDDLDFGYGWSVGFQTLRVSESRTPGAGWQFVQQGGGAFAPTCSQPLGDRVVSVRMPDGSMERFRAKAEPECVQYGAEPYVQLIYEPLGDTDARLEQRDYGLLTVIDGNLVDPDQPGVPVDPHRYRLTTPDGLVFALDQGYTLTELTDTDGNTLTFSDSGIEHSSGVRVDFVRDATGRITQVVAPDGTALSYGYDAAGDLVSVTDQLGYVTQFSYLADHFVEQIVDPEGHPIARNEYDQDGRVIAHVDALGNRIEYTHDLIGGTETIRDRRGNATIYAYNDRGDIVSETNALGETTLHDYDGYGNETSRTDALGHTTSWSYDSVGNRLSETDALGRMTSFSYDPFNQPLTQTAPDGTVVSTSTYEARVGEPGRLSSIADALGNTTTFGYDGAGNVGALTDAEGNASQFSYNIRGDRTHEVAPNGRVTDSVFDTNGRVLRSTTYRDGQAQTTVYAYDDAGRLISTTGPDGEVSHTEYDGNGQVTAEVDALGRRTEYEYDERGQRSLTRYPDGSTESVEYDANGNEVALSDRAGRTTRMVYDAADRLTDTIYPDDTPGYDGDNPRIRTEYDAAGRMTASVDERGNRTTYGYDAAGQRTSVTDALGNITRFEYDARGNRTAMVDALSRRSEYRYDAADRLFETRHPDGTSTYTYRDGLGRSVIELDAASRQTTFEYGPEGDLTAVIDAMGQRTEYGYDEQSNRVSQRDAAGRSTTWAYDDLGRPLSHTLPLGQSESFGYDAVGQRTGRTDFNAAASSFEYDAMGRSTRETYADGTEVLTTYTASGMVATVTDAQGVTRNSYDARDRLTRIEYPSGQVVSYAYDAAGNRTQVISAAGQVDYSYDALNRLATVTDAQGTTTYHYDAVGRTEAVDHADGSRTAYLFDDMDRVIEVRHLAAGGALIGRERYTLGATGHRLAIEDLDGRTVSYGYDPLYRLTRETVTDAVRGDRETLWSYDAVGNRSTQTACTPRCGAGGTETLTTYSYDANDRLLSETQGGSVTTTSWDANGNTLQSSGPAGTTTYSYDRQDRLVAASTPASQLGFSYDALGIRQSRTTDGVTTRFVVDPNRPYAQVLAEMDGSGQVRTAYTYGLDLLSQTQGAATHTFHYDALGTTRLLTDGSGQVSDDYVYGAFGELEASSGTTANAYLFTGEQYDAGLGQYYLRARYMDPSVGRFTQMDTFAGIATQPLSLHRYSYVSASPIQMVDPSGQFGLSDTAGALTVAGTIYSTYSAISNISQGNYVGAATDVALGILGTGAITLKTVQFMARAGKPIRLVYRAIVTEGFPQEIARLRSLGYSSEEIARRLVVLRNQAKSEARALMEADGVVGRALSKLAALRNRIFYGNPIGPTAEQMLKRKGSWEEVINSAQRVSERVNAFIDLLTL